jgi:NDP-sugar pyrophosphorylase family protein
MDTQDRLVVIIAGGLGSRLKPYTTVLPKPLMPVGNMPILEIILHQLRESGFRRVILAVNHFDGLLRSYFGNGDALGVSITYSKESQPLGTVGPLHLVAEQLPETFLMMNGDVLTDMNYDELWESHMSSGCGLTLSVHRRRMQIPVGVIDVAEDGTVSKFREKPSIDLWTSMGIYAMNRTLLPLIPRDRSFGMDGLASAMLESGRSIDTFRHEGECHDIGVPKNLEEANDAFNERRELFLSLEAELVEVS